MHALMCTHIKYHKGEYTREAAKEEALMKGNTRIIRVKNGSANIKWCEKIRGAFFQVHHVVSTRKKIKENNDKSL